MRHLHLILNFCYIFLILVYVPSSSSNVPNLFIPHNYAYISDASSCYASNQKATVTYKTYTGNRIPIADLLHERDINGAHNAITGRCEVIQTSPYTVWTNIDALSFDKIRLQLSLQKGEKSQRATIRFKILKPVDRLLLRAKFPSQSNSNPQNAFISTQLPSYSNTLTTSTTTTTAPTTYRPRLFALFGRRIRNLALKDLSCSEPKEDKGDDQERGCEEVANEEGASKAGFLEKLKLYLKTWKYALENVFVSKNNSKEAPAEFPQFVSQSENEAHIQQKLNKSKEIKSPVRKQQHVDARISYISESFSEMHPNRFMVGWKCTISDIRWMKQRRNSSGSKHTTNIEKTLNFMYEKNNINTATPERSLQLLNVSDLTASHNTEVNKSLPVQLESCERLLRGKLKPLSTRGEDTKRRSIWESMVSLIGEHNIKSNEVLFKRSKWDELGVDKQLNELSELEVMGTPTVKYLQNYTKGAPVCRIDLITLEYEYGNTSSLEGSDYTSRGKNGLAEEEFEYYFRIYNAVAEEFSQSKYARHIAYILPDAAVQMNSISTTGKEENSKHKFDKVYRVEDTLDEEGRNFEEVSRLLRNAKNDEMNEQLKMNDEYTEVLSISDWSTVDDALLEEIEYVEPSFLEANESSNFRQLRSNSSHWVEEPLADPTVCENCFTQSARYLALNKNTVVEQGGVSTDSVFSEYTPNDPLYLNQWFLQANFYESSKYRLYNKEGSTRHPLCGIDAVGGWEFEDQRKQQNHLFGAPVIVAIIDTGVDYLHHDLHEQMWVNTAELYGIPGYDDDGNGYIDDIHGWNFHHKNNNPMDDSGHGTHVTGVVAASRNNAEGVCGICENAKIMALKVLANDGRGDISAVLQGIYYALENNAKILTNSWGGLSGFSQGSFLLLSKLLTEALDEASESVFVIAAGNLGRDITTVPFYPGSLMRDWSITVASSDEDGGLSSFSNYGKKDVHLSAPGNKITSSWVGNEYLTISGTSMAAPMVSGVACLVLSSYPMLPPQQVVDLLMDSAVIVPSHTNVTMSSSVVNAANALESAASHFFVLQQQSYTNLKEGVEYEIHLQIQVDVELTKGQHHATVEIRYVNTEVYDSTHELIAINIPVVLYVR